MMTGNSGIPPSAINPRTFAQPVNADLNNGFNYMVMPANMLDDDDPEQDQQQQMSLFSTQIH